MSIRLSGAVALVALAGLSWWWLGGSAFDVSTLRDVRDSIGHRVQHSPAWSALAFIAAYLLVAALALPGALVLTLLGGALFGFGPGSYWWRLPRRSVRWSRLASYAGLPVAGFAIVWRLDLPRSRRASSAMAPTTSLLCG